MKQFTIVMLASFHFCFILPVFVNAQTADDRGASKYNGIWWTNNDILADQATLKPEDRAVSPTEIKAFYPNIKGVFVTVKWADIEPNFLAVGGQFFWDSLDVNLRRYKDAGLYMILMIWVGPDGPPWIYNKPNPGIPKVLTDDIDHGEYPYYLEVKNGVKVYQKYWYRMLDSVANHVKLYAGPLRQKIVIYQSAEGSTGDEGPYKGDVTDTAYAIPRLSTEWVQFKQEAWQRLYSLYRTNYPYTPKMHLLINCDPGDPEDDNNWVKNNIPDTWRKASNAGHGYQFNDEITDKSDFDPLVNATLTNTDSATKIRCRDEMDQYKTKLFLQAPKWNIYWTALSALYYGLDMWPNNATGLKDTINNKSAFDFFSKYAGYKNPKYSPGAFCALRDGLNAADVIRFPTTSPSNGGYGQGTQDAGDANGERRCERIANAFAAYGAKQQDAAHAQGGVQNQKISDSLNDVGWNIFAGNYERYLTQYKPNETSVGWWRVGDINEPYGRFARAFKHTAGGEKDTMFFDIDDKLFTTNFNLNTDTVKIRIVYYDEGNGGAWKVLYDAIGNNAKQARAYTNNAPTAKWRETIIAITDGSFSNGCKHGTDLMIVNTDAINEKFHLIEIIKVKKI